LVGGVEFTQLEEALPALEPGAEHLFLLKQVDNRYYPVGMFVGAFGIVGGKLRPLSQIRDFAPEYQEMPAVEAVADLVGRLRAMRQRSPK
jgi:hypothetical protein